MPLASLSSKRGVTGCSFSVWLGLSRERVKDGWLSQGQNASCQESRAQGTGKKKIPFSWSSPALWEGSIEAAQQTPPQALPWLRTKQLRVAQHRWSILGAGMDLGDSWKSLCNVSRFLLPPTASWLSSTLASFYTNSLKVLWADRMNCTTNPTWSPTQHVNRIISTMEDQDREKLIIETAKMKHKNKLCLVLYLCPQCLFFHPQLSAISLSRKLISFFSTFHQHT